MTEIRLERLSDSELDALEVGFVNHKPAPPKRSIQDDKHIVSQIDMSHQSACEGEPFYSIIESHSSFYEGHRAINLRDAATIAFRYGDMQSTLQYLSAARSELGYAPGHAGYRGGLLLAKSIYDSMLGRTQEAVSEYASGESLIAARYSSSSPRQRKLYDMWRREASSIIVYGEGRTRESEIRLRELRRFWEVDRATSGLYVTPLITEANIVELMPSTDTAITNTTFIEYLIAMSLIGQGRFVEAESYIRARLWQIEDPIDLAWMFDALGSAFMQQGRFADAEWTARYIAKFFRQHCAPTHYFTVYRSYVALADALATQGKWEEALEWYQLSIIQVGQDDSGEFTRLVLERPELGIAQMYTGDFSAARASLLTTMSLLEDKYGEDSYQVAETRTFIDLVSVLDTRSSVSITALGKSISSLLAKSSTGLEDSALMSIREIRLSLIVEAFLEIGFGKLDREIEFQIAQIGRSDKVQAALASSTLRAQVDDPELADLLRKYQDILTRRDLLSRSLVIQANMTTSSKTGLSSLELEAELKLLELARVTAVERITTQFPEISRLTTTGALKPDEVLEFLKQDESIILVRSFDKTTYVWSVNPTGHIATHKTEVGREEISALIKLIRSSVDPGSLLSLGDIPRFNVNAAHRLYTLLLDPLKAHWRDTPNLVIATDNDLGRIPLSLLVTEAFEGKDDSSLRFASYRQVKWLSRSHAVSSIPSLSTLKALRSRNSDSSKNRFRFVGFGDPVFFKEDRPIEPQSSEECFANGALKEKCDGGMASRVALRSKPQTRQLKSASLRDLPHLPDTRDELISIAKSLGVDPTTSVYLGESASENTVFSTDLADVQVLSFATHGLAAGDLDGLNEPALALSSPEVTGDENSDGLLGLSEILGLKLNADWVVLSACNTAANDGSGAGAVSGLGRAFFYAGTKSILVSHWPVHSLATTNLMQSIFSRYGDNTGISRAEALRLAQNELMDNITYRDANGSALFSYAHPIFWAPFTLVGDGGAE